MTGKTSGESIFEYYNRGYNVGVGGAVVKAGRLLLVRRASAYGRGNWQIPGGFIERTETMEDAVVREVEEEAGGTASPRGNTGDTQQAVRRIEQHLRGFSNELDKRRAAGGRYRDGPGRVVFA